MQWRKVHSTMLIATLAFLASTFQPMADAAPKAAAPGGDEIGRAHV